MSRAAVLTSPSLRRCHRNIVVGRRSWAFPSANENLHPSFSWLLEGSGKRSRRDTVLDAERRHTERRVTAGLLRRPPHFAVLLGCLSHCWSPERTFQKAGSSAQAFRSCLIIPKASFCACLSCLPKMLPCSVTHAECSGFARPPG